MNPILTIGVFYFHGYLLLMKKVIKISEEKLEKVVLLVMEALGDYADEDYIEAFLITFRQWITEKLGDESKKYPLSLLLNKYGSQFEEAFGLGQAMRHYEDSSSYNTYRLKRVARELVNSGKYQLPSMKSDVKFTEKYGKAINHFLEQLDLPDYVTVKLEENTPNEVTLKVDVDFPTMIKQQKYRTISTSSIEHKLRKYLEDYLGVEFGNPVYGEVSMRTDKPNYVGLDEWVKNVLNKKIKKEIKVLAPNLIHAVRFDVSSGRATLKIVFKDSGWGRRSEAMKKIKDYLALDYNPDLLRVEY